MAPTGDVRPLYLRSQAARDKILRAMPIFNEKGLAGAHEGASIGEEREGGETGGQGKPAVEARVAVSPEVIWWSLMATTRMACPW